MPLVEIPNVGEVEFPDDMSHDDIATAIQRDIIRDPMPSVPAPGGSVSLSPDPNISTLPTAFPAQEARTQANIAAQTPELSVAEAGQMLTTPYAQVPQALVQAPALRAAQALLPGQAGEVAGQVATGAANLTKGVIEQALMTPASGPLGVTAMVPGVREAAGLGASALASKAAGEKLGEFSVTKDPQALTEGVGLAVMAALGGTATGIGVSRSQPREFLRALIDENRSAKEIPVELVREPRPPGTPPPEPVQRPAIEEGGQRLLAGPEEAKLTPQQRALLDPEPPRQLTEGEPTVAPSSPDGPSPQALGLVPPIPKVVRELTGAVGSALDWYSQPLTERLATSRGPTAQGFSNMAKEIVHRSKALYGSITPVLDPALEATGALNRTTTWLNDIAPTTQPWGYRNAVAAVEGPASAVPADHLPTVQKLKDANLEIGRLAQTGVPGFVASGKYQRNLTAFAVDTIRTGKGPAHDLLVQALSTENNIPASRVRSVLLDTKAELDAPGSKQTIHRIAQEFERHFKKFPTDLKISTGLGDVWMPILHAKPFNYLSHAALATAQRVAFLERIPQGTLDQLRQQVVGELKDPAAFDDLVRALHGLSIDEPWRLASPGSTVGMLASGANRVLTDVFGALKLSASALTNIPETIIGNTPAFLGWRNFLEGAATLPKRHADLEALGAINRAIYNWSLDRNAPVRTLLSTFRNGMRKVTLQQVFNEVQEKLAASAAQVLTERARGRTLGSGEQNAMIETAVAMGFERPAARALAIGHATPEQYQDFVRRAPTFLTGGNQMMAETSRLGANRMFSSAFRFQSYPQMKLNTLRKAWGNFADAIEAGDSDRFWASAKTLSKFLFNTTAQGVGAAFLAALFAGRKGGVVVTAEDALEGPGAFFLDSLMAGMGGPAAAIHYALSSGRLRDKLDPRNINLGSVFPGAIYLELKQMFNREGPYAGMTLTEAAEKYAQSKVPAGRVIYRALRAAGLLDSADDSTADLYQRMRLWRDKSENPKVVKQKEAREGQTFGESAYAGLRQALKANDRERAIEAYRELVKTRDRATVRRAMESSRPFTGSWDTERLFRASLDADGRELYRKAQRERELLAARFRAFIP